MGFFDSFRTHELADEVQVYITEGRLLVLFHVLSQLQSRGFASSNIIQVARRILDRTPQATLISLAATPGGNSLIVLIGRILRVSAPGNQNEARSIRIRTALDSARPREAANQASQHYTIDAGITLSQEAIGYLDRIGVQYFEQTGSRFNVNSGTRTPSSQADAMYTVIQSGDRTLSLYNRTNVTPILEAYRTASTTGRTRQQIVQSMADAIQSQVNRGVYISNHLRAGGIDISVRGDVGIPAMTADQKRVMIEIARRITGGQAFEERRPPHIHIQYQ